MKALTIMQPWASLIILGQKEYETRGWSTQHRGPLVIHASKQKPRGSAGDDGLPRGCILGIVELVDCLSTNDFVPPSVAERELGDYTPNRWAWKLRVLQKFETPIPFSGKQSLWDISVGFLPEFKKELVSCP